MNCPPCATTVETEDHKYKSVYDLIIQHDLNVGAVNDWCYIGNLECRSTTSDCSDLTLSSMEMP